MKRLVQFGTIVLGFCLLSCEKNGSANDNNGLLIGQWHIVTDTSYVGVGLNNHSVNFVGQKSDYFSFQSDGKLFIEESGSRNVLNYVLTSDSTITIDSFLHAANGEPEKCFIIYFAKNDIVVSTEIAATPGGVFGRKVHLVR